MDAIARGGVHGWPVGARRILDAAIELLLLVLGRRVRPEQEEYNLDEPERPPPCCVLRALQRFAVQDWLVLAYLALLLVGVRLGDGPRRPIATAWLGVDLVCVGGCLLVTRAGVVRPALLSGLLYRFALFGAVISSFLQMQYILPTAASRVVDAQLHAFDLLVFGVEPAVAWDADVTERATEWFSFFYFGYFFLIAIHVIPVMLLERRTKILAEFSFGMLFVFCTGHVLYLVVPGYGPYQALAGSFTHELSGERWWPLVEAAVASVDGAARLDIFPSLHTGGPTFLALFSMRHRAERPFSKTWRIVVFSTSQIIVATLYLRWHYLADVCAGFLLAMIGVVAAGWVAAEEPRARARYDLGPVFEALEWRVRR